MVVPGPTCADEIICGPAFSMLTPTGAGSMAFSHCTHGSMQKDAFAAPGFCCGVVFAWPKASTNPIALFLSESWPKNVEVFWMALGSLLQPPRGVGLVLLQQRRHCGTCRFTFCGVWRCLGQAVACLEPVAYVIGFCEGQLVTKPMQGLGIA